MNRHQFFLANVFLCLFIMREVSALFLKTMALYNRHIALVGKQKILMEQYQNEFVLLSSVVK